MEQLNKARSEISAIDAEMARLFERRMAAAREVADYKRRCGLPIYDAEREQALLARGAELIQDEELRSYYVGFLQKTMDLSKSYQHRLLEGVRVAYSGVPGAFAEIAADRIFPDAVKVACKNFGEAYAAVEKGECDLAVLPVENSTNGDVGQVMDLTFFGSLHICGIYEIEIIQNLLGLPGSSVKDIKTVLSHPQAIGQCLPYIEEHGFTVVEVVNTAVAAKTVAEGGDKTVAAIGSEEAGRKYGLQKLEGKIEQTAGNTTRFAVLSRAEKAPDAGDNRFVMTFTVNNEAGSLGRAVSVIGWHGFNLRALKSRPTKKLGWDYYFYAEGEGNIHSNEGAAMLRELKTCCNSVRVLGSYKEEIK